MVVAFIGEEENVELTRCWLMPGSKSDRRKYKSSTRRQSERDRCLHQTHEPSWLTTVWVPPKYLDFWKGSLINQMIRSIQSFSASWDSVHGFHFERVPITYVLCVSIRWKPQYCTNEISWQWIRSKKFFRYVFRTSVIMWLYADWN